MRKALTALTGALCGISSSCGVPPPCFLGPTQYAQLFSKPLGVVNAANAEGVPDGEYAVIPAAEVDKSALFLWFPDRMGDAIRPILRSAGTDVEIRIYDFFRCRNTSECRYDLQVASFNLQGDRTDWISLTDAMTQLYDVLTEDLQQVEGEGPIAILDFGLILEIRNRGPGALEVDAVASCLRD